MDRVNSGWLGHFFPSHLNGKTCPDHLKFTLSNIKSLIFTTGGIWAAKHKKIKMSLREPPFTDKVYVHRFPSIWIYLIILQILQVSLKYALKKQMKIHVLKKASFNVFIIIMARSVLSYQHAVNQQNVFISVCESSRIAYIANKLSVNEKSSIVIIAS